MKKAHDGVMLPSFHGYTRAGGWLRRQRKLEAPAMAAAGITSVWVEPGLVASQATTEQTDRERRWAIDTSRARAVGLWVPSILAFGGFVRSALQRA